MRKTITIMLFTLSCASLALAQSNNWTGFYVGGNGFAASDKSEASENLQISQISNLQVPGRGIFVVPGTTRELDASKRETNGGGGFQTGFQWQVRGFVFGPEADFNLIKRTTTVSQTFQLPVTIISPVTTVEARRDVEVSREFSIRVRAGGAVGKTLIYGTFGYALGRVKVSVRDSFINPGGLAAPCGTFDPPTCTPVNLSASGPIVTAGSDEQNMGGWTGGFGVERKLGKRFSIGFEYRHTDLRSKNFVFTDSTVTNTGPQPTANNIVAGIFGGVNGAFGFSSATTVGGVSGDSSTKISLKSDSFGVRFNFHF
jgi:outer membrane immunogenic protein